MLQGGRCRNIIIVIFIALLITCVFIINEHLPAIIHRGLVIRFCPQGRGICTAISLTLSSRTYKNNLDGREFATLNRPQGWRICNLAIANPHYCPTWGSWGLTMIGALKHRCEYVRKIQHGGACRETPPRVLYFPYTRVSAVL